VRTCSLQWDGKEIVPWCTFIFLEVKVTLLISCFMCQIPNEHIFKAAPDKFYKFNKCIMFIWKVSKS
jgi:hypothetical protein